MQKKLSIIIIIASVIGLFSVVAIERGHQTFRSIAPSDEPKTAQHESRWEAYGTGVDRREYWFQNSTQGRTILYRFRQEDFQVRLMHRVPPLTVRDWLTPDMQDTLVVNGVYFNEADLPVGYTVIDGKRLGNNMVSGKTTTMVGLSPTVRMSVDRPTARDGFQTYPVLVRDGNAAVSADSKQYARRTFIGTDVLGNVYIGVVPDSAISLYELARILAGMDIQWSMAANLDGGPSTGLAARFGKQEEYFDSMTLIPNVLMIQRR